MFDKLIGFSIKNKMVISLFTIALIVWGVYSFKKLPIDALPDITNNQVTVITVAPTVAAQEIESFITNPLEISMSNLPDVKEIRSISRFGLSVITVVFDDKVETHTARQLVAEKIKQAEAEIPDGLGKPEMGPITTGLGEIYQYTIHTKKGFENKFSAQDLRTIQDWIVRRQLAGVQGITEVSAWGGEMKQYEVSIDPNRLNAMNVTISEVFEALHNGNENTGGAYIEKGSNVSFIRGIGMVKTIEDIENIVIKTVDNMPILVRNIGTVNFGSAPRYGAITRNGQGEVVAGITLMLKGENSSKVIEHVKERMAEIQKSLPDGVVIDPYIERSALVKRAISTVEKNLIEGGLIVIFVLVLLLGNLRAGLVVASVIPLAMLFAIAMMNLFGVSGNLMSLGAIDFGLIVDGAVIIIEATLHHITGRSINKHIGNGKLTQAEMDEEVYQSATKIRSSAAFGEIIIMIVYLPILALVGIEGKMFAPMAQTVSFAILGALILSLTYVPMASALFLSKNTHHKKNISDKIMAFFERLYMPVITKALKRKGIIIISAIVLFVTSLFMFLRMGGEFIPTLEEGDFAIEFGMMQGTSLTQMTETTTKAEKILKSKFPEVKQVVTRIGSAEIPTDPMPIERGDIMVALKDKSEWTSAETKEELMEKMEEALKGGLIGVNLEITQPIQMRFNELMTGIRQDVAIKIYGDDMDVLASEADKVSKLIAGIEGVGTPNIEKVAGLPQIAVNYKRDKLAQYGIKVNDVNRVITAAFAGEKAGVVLEGEKKFDLVVRFNKNFRQDINDVSQLYVLTDNGVKIPLNQIADVSYKEGPAQVSHDNTKRRIFIGFNVSGRDVESVVKEIQAKLDTQLKLPPGYNITYGGQFQNLTEAKERLSIAVPVALLLIFMLLFFTFSSFKQALLIFTAIPLSAIGGVFALYLRGMPFSISAGVGFIALFGVAVLNGIVLIGYFNQLKKEGMEDLMERVLTGVRVRLRPVIMTAAVASLGFLPMALSHGAGAEVQKPLATVVIGGLISATLLTLIVLPILYVLFEKMKTKTTKVIAPAVITILLFGSTTIQAQNNGSLDEWIAKGLKNNNSVLAADAEVKSSQYLKKTSTEIGKTNVSLTYGQYNSYANKDNNLTISQSLPFPTTFAAKSKLAGSVMESHLLKKKLTESEVVYQIKQVYYQWLNLNQRKELLLRRDSVYKALAKASALRYKTGESNLLEKSSTEARSKEVENQLMQMENDKIALAGRVKALLTSPIATFEEAELKEAVLSLQVDSSLATKNPFVVYMKQQISIAENQKKVDKNALMPDITLGYFNQTLYGVPYGNDVTAPLANYGNRFQGFSAGISIPLWFAPQSAKVKAAEYSKQNAELQYKQAQNNALAEIEAAYTEYLKTQKSLQYYKSSGLPNAELITKQSTIAFQKGEINYSQHVLNLQQADEIKQNYLQTLLEYNHSVIALEFLSGSIK
ncbi:MAG: CusA/CzcA family heavy metal efflux RND transporter [Bacteroidetes bacterium]|nr:CusA/CzcA family heavy metal efflux RND transporter [Bacteroidota bacterium]